MSNKIAHHGMENCCLLLSHRLPPEGQSCWMVARSSTDALWFRKFLLISMERIGGSNVTGGSECRN